MSIRSAWLALMMIAVASAARADSLDERFRVAVAALDHRQPEIAAHELRALVALGVEDPDVYLDLGIAEAESTRYGAAIVAFERALALRPSDATARRGLENAETMLARRRAERRGEATTVEAQRPLAALGRAVPERLAAIGSLVFAWLAAASIAALAFVRRESRRIGLGIAAAGATLVALFFVLAIHGRTRPPGVMATAVVVVDRATLRVAPDPQAPARTSLDEGERADLVERYGSFVRLARDGRSLGWLPRASVGTY